MARVLAGGVVVMEFVMWVALAAGVWGSLSGWQSPFSKGGAF